MSKRFLLLLIIVVLAISVLIASVLIAVNSAYFNYIPNTMSTAPTNDNAVIIQSPQNGATYNATSLPLYFTVQSNDDFFSV